MRQLKTRFVFARMTDWSLRHSGMGPYFLSVRALEFHTRPVIKLFLTV